MSSSISFQKLFGVSIHPDYGGWFAFRSVLVLPDRTLPQELHMTGPPDIVPDSDKLRLLEMFNYSWMTGEYRDIIDPKSRYSQAQIEYFTTPPKDRQPLIEKLMQMDEQTECLT